ncbi:MAG: tripartite tricarboxylate transporter substrate-binding protein, partial [Betaproteobacteria bacterium]
MKQSLVAFFLLIGFISGVSAQSYPDHPLRMVIPYVPGGTTDLLGRWLAEAASETLGQTVVVENRAGAGG